MKQRVAVTWEMCGFIEVEADSLEEAMNEVSENPDDYPLPSDGEYVDGSYSLSTDDVNAMKAMCAIYSTSNENLADRIDNAQSRRDEQHRNDNSNISRDDSSRV